MSMQEALRGLRGTAVVGAAVVSRDGTVIAADLPEGVSRETFSIMCATIHGAGMTVSSQVRRSNPRRIVLESDGGHILILEAGRRALLALVLAADADVDAASQQVTPVLEQIVRETA